MVFRVPTRTFPSAVANASSPALPAGHARAVTGWCCRNLLQMLFLSPHSAPSLYTKTMLSLCPMASFVEQGENAMPRTTKFFGPSLCAGFVLNLSRFAPESSNICTTRSVVTAARRLALGLLFRRRREGRVSRGTRQGGTGSVGDTRKVNVPIARCRSRGDAPCYRRDLLYALVRREDCVQVPELHGRRLHRVRLRSDDEGTSRSPDLKEGSEAREKKRHRAFRSRNRLSDGSGKSKQREFNPGS